MSKSEDNKTEMIEKNRAKSTSNKPVKVEFKKVGSNVKKNKTIKYEKNADKNTEKMAVSLKEIKEVIKQKVYDNQKKIIMKEVFVNLIIAVIMIIFLEMVLLGTKNIYMSTFEIYLKVIVIVLLAIGIFILEMAYKKDNIKIALNAVEVIIFSGVNLCLIYSIKLNNNNIMCIIVDIAIVIVIYYVVKAIIMSVINVKKFKKENNDIKEIIKK